ncbi:Uncharacterised protein [Acinetobacter baumannii]|nr:Uncharacterised protein [Acinetobacter baumannii]
MDMEYQPHLYLPEQPTQGHLAYKRKMVVHGLGQNPFHVHEQHSYGRHNTHGVLEIYALSRE